MSIQLNLQLLVPDENREKLMLLLAHAKNEIKGYFDANPNASPPYANDHTEPGVGEIAMTYNLVTVSTPLANGLSSFSFQTVDAATDSKQFTFTAAATIRFLVTAANAGNTKGLAKDIRVNQTLTTSNIHITGGNDFGTADVSVAATPGSVTLTVTGEAGETIDWKVICVLVSI